MPKTHEKVMKITRFDLLRGAFIEGDQASRRVPKIKQNVAKMHQKSSRNEHEKMWIPMLQLSKMHAVDRPLKMHGNAFIFVVPDVALLTPRMQKSFKNVENSSKMLTKIRSPVLQWSNTRAVGRPAKIHKTRSFLSFPMLLC